MDRQMYFVALSGVTRYALSEAIKAVHRNALGHPFFPAPSELRRLCDEAQAPVDRQAERERDMREQSEDRRRAAHYDALRTPAAKACVSAAYARFCAGYEAPENFVPTLDPALVALIPDNPNPPKPFKNARAA